MPYNIKKHKSSRTPDMIYGEKPSFDKIMESIAALETEINGLA